MSMSCPSCGTEIVIPEGFTGVQRQCTSCRRFVLVPRASRQAAAQPEMGPVDSAPAAPPAKARKRIAYRRPVDRDDGPFEFERKGTSAGLVGGLVMMAIAAVWFFVGLAGGIIFFYPPILFIIGVIAAINGLVSGGSQRPSRVRRRRG